MSLFFGLTEVVLHRLKADLAAVLAWAEGLDTVPKCEELHQMLRAVETNLRDPQIRDILKVPRSKRLCRVVTMMWVVLLCCLGEDSNTRLHHTEACEPMT